MSKGIKKTNTKTVKKPKKSSSKKESKDITRRYFSYRLVKRYRNVKSKMKKDNSFSNNFGSTKPTIIDLGLIDAEHQRTLDNTIINDVFFDNQEEPDFFSYDNICQVNSNKEINPNNLEYYRRFLKLKKNFLY